MQSNESAMIEALARALGYEFKYEMETINSPIGMYQASVVKAVKSDDLMCAHKMIERSAKVMKYMGSEYKNDDGVVWKKVYDSNER